MQYGEWLTRQHVLRRKECGCLMDHRLDMNQWHCTVVKILDGTVEFENKSVIGKIYRPMKNPYSYSAQVGP